MTYCGQSLLGTYQGTEIFQCHNSGVGGGNGHYRITKLHLPAGQNGEIHPAFHFHYAVPKPGVSPGYTVAENSDGTKTVYHFSAALLPTAIQHIRQNGTLQREKCFTWNSNQWLQSISVKDSNTTLHMRSYEYDRFGNPILEVFTGNLTGEGEESYTIKRKFSEEGRHLLLKEEREEGKTTCFTYLPNTNLITSKFTKEKEDILLREFFLYDDCHNLIREIHDDGKMEDPNDLSGVTQRTSTYYSLRQEAPFLHMPEWIEEKYQEGKNEILLKRTHLTYDQHGNIAKEEVFDADGKHAYTLYKEYNERGDIVTETNALGQKAYL